MNDWDDTTSVALQPTAADKSESVRDRAYLVVIAGSNVGEMFKVNDDQTILGRSSDADMRLTDDGISRHHCKLRVDGNRILVEDLDSRNGTFCNGDKLTIRELQDGDKLQLGKTTILKFSYQDHLEESFQKQMLHSALRDGLTGTYNKRYFMDRLDSELKFALRHNKSLSLLFLDLDHFKAVNDTYGHLAGDEALRCFAKAMQKSIRNEDVLARYGGEEFAIISRSIPLPSMVLFADRLRKQTEALKIESRGLKIALTVSIGIASVPEDSVQTVEDLIAVADKRLYEAKAAGRNRVSWKTPA